MGNFKIIKALTEIPRPFVADTASKEGGLQREGKEPACDERWRRWICCHPRERTGKKVGS